MTVFDNEDDVQGKTAFLALNAILGALLIFAVMLLVGAANFAIAGGHPAIVCIVSICGLSIGGAGLGLLYHLHFRSRVLAARDAAILRRFPDQPWMLNPDWAKGRLDDPQIGRVFFMIVFITGWIGGIAFIIVANFDQILPELQSSPAAWAAAAFFVLTTASIINVAFKVALSWATIGNGALQLETLPGRIGGQLVAKLATRLRRRPASGLQVDLTCMRYRRYSAGPGDRHDVEVVWSRSTTVMPRQMRKSDQGLVVPIVVDIDPGLPESGAQNQEGTVEWRLRVASIGTTEPFVLFEWPVPIYRVLKKSVAAAAV